MAEELQRKSEKAKEYKNQMKQMSEEL